MNPVSRRGTVHSFVTEFDGSGKINPTPATAKDSDPLSDFYFSTEKLVSKKKLIILSKLNLYRF